MKQNNYYNLIIVILLLALIVISLSLVAQEKIIAEQVERLKLAEQVEKIETELKQVEEVVEAKTYSDADLYRDMIRTYCKVYGYNNPELAIAISRTETGNWKSAAFLEYNNVGGISIREKPLYYSDLCKGMEAYMKTLMWYQDDLGLTTAKEMQPKYCPANKGWTTLVEELEKEEIAIWNKSNIQTSIG